MQVQHNGTTELGQTRTKQSRATRLKFNCRAGYMREAEVAVSVFNALNDRHREHPLGDLIGSRVLGWLTLKF
jgi:hypothetical protein